MKQQARVRGVVVGDEHDRLARAGIARPREHVGRRAARQHAAQQVAAVVDVVGHQRGGEPGDRSPAAAMASPDNAGCHRGERSGAGRAPEPAARTLALELRRQAARAQHVGEQRGGVSLTVGGRAALDRRQPLDVLARGGGDRHAREDARSGARAPRVALGAPSDARAPGRPGRPSAVLRRPGTLAA